MKYKILSHISAVFFGALLPFSLWAEEPAEIPFLAGEQGEMIRTIWKDGREASTMSGIVEPLIVEVPLTIYENSCNEFLASKCKLAVGMQHYSVYFKWTKHPDPTKIGKTLRMRPKQRKTPKDESYFDVIPLQNVFVAINRAALSPIAARNVPRDVLICDNYNFLPKDPFTPPYMKVLRWEMEIMSVNPETGAAENRTLGGALNVDLIPTSEGHLSLDQKYFTYGEMIGGDIISLTLRDKNNQLCQIGMKPDLVEAFEKVQAYYSTVPKKFQPYYAGVDELFTPVFQNIKNLLQQPSQFELEP